MARWHANNSNQYNNNQKWACLLGKSQDNSHLDRYLGHIFGSRALRTARGNPIFINLVHRFILPSTIGTRIRSDSPKIIRLHTIVHGDFRADLRSTGCPTPPENMPAKCVCNPGHEPAWKAYSRRCYSSGDSPRDHHAPPSMYLDRGSAMFLQARGESRSTLFASSLIVTSPISCSR